MVFTTRTILLPAVSTHLHTFPHHAYGITWHASGAKHILQKDCYSAGCACRRAFHGPSLAFYMLFAKGGVGEIIDCNFNSLAQILGGNWRPTTLHTHALCIPYVKHEDLEKQFYSTSAPATFTPHTVPKLATSSFNSSKPK